MKQRVVALTTICVVAILALNYREHISYNLENQSRGYLKESTPVKSTAIDIRYNITLSYDADKSIANNEQQSNGDLPASTFQNVPSNRKVNTRGHYTSNTGENKEIFGLDERNHNSDFNSSLSFAGYDGKSKLILLWNPYFEQPDYGVGFGTRTFHAMNCTKTCFLTGDKGLFVKADAVVVHTFNMISDITVPHPATKKQIFVFANFESPMRSWSGLDQNYATLLNRFNLTMTYMSAPETDVLTPIGYSIKKTQPDAKAVPRLTKLKSKTKLVSWVVSNCQAPSSRNEYVRELQKYISVDIYGYCGNLTCPIEPSCFRYIGKEYMFYLAFENSYCKDYVTEKVFRTLTLNIVPVVLGDGNYSRVLPPRSFIDVRDFHSPKHLAKYLHSLRRNTTEYQQYFQWKEHFSVYTNWRGRAVGFCRLCEILNQPRYPYKTVFDPLDYWNPDMYCLQDEMERKAVHLRNEIDR